MERLTDDQLRWLATKALNDDVDHLASEFYNILTELQERRKAPWSRDVEALKEHLNTGKAVVVFGSTEQYSHVVETYVEGKGYFGRETWIYYTNPIAWLPWEG